MTTITPTKVTIELPRWLARKEDIVSRELTGEVLAVRGNGIFFRGAAVVRPSDHCLRCGLEIKNPVSRLAGYGPWCSDKLGIPRDFTEADLAAIRALVENRVIECWFPRNRVRIIDGELPRSNVEVLAVSDVEHAAERGAEKARVYVRSPYIETVTPFSAKDLVKSVPGRRWNGERKVWQWAISEHSAIELVTKLRNADYDVEIDERIAELIGQAEGLAAAASYKSDEVVPAIELDALGQPPHWEHQRRAFHAARGQNAYLLAIGMGGGKSRVAVDLVRDEGDKRVLIICPKNVVGVWPKQFRLYAGESVDVIAPRYGPKGGELSLPKRVEEIRAALDAPSDGTPVVVVVNYEAAWRPPLGDTVDDRGRVVKQGLLTSTQWDRVILDESHRIKKATGKAAKQCARIATSARRRLALTGTPMPHSPLDVFGQYKFLDPGIFGNSFVAFRNHYAVMGGYGGYEVLGYQRESELAEKVYRIAYRIADAELDEALGLVEPVHETRLCHLSPSAQKTYNSLSSQFYAAVGRGEVTVGNALTRLLRLQQVTSGHLPVEEADDEGEIERHVIEIDTAKRDELLDLLEDVPPGQPVVVVTRFTHDLDSVAWVAAKLGRSYAELSGRRHDALTEDSTLAPGVEVAGVQIQSGGVGVDLSAAHICVLYSVGFSLGDYDQVLKRTHRPGQTNRVAYYHLVCEDTVDEKVYAALRDRKNVVEYVLGLAE